MRIINLFPGLFLSHVITNLFPEAGDTPGDFIRRSQRI